MYCLSCSEPMTCASGMWFCKCGTRMYVKPEVPPPDPGGARPKLQFLVTSLYMANL